MAFDPSKYSAPKAKPLPVMLLLDSSGSMRGVKMDTLNSAVHTMLDDFGDLSKNETDIVVSIIEFNNGAFRHCPFTTASQVNYQDLTAGGGTNMGQALKMAKDIIEDKEETPGNAYRPLIILVSDGMPNNGWETPLREFVGGGRSQKCDRMAMAIGVDACKSVLEQFTEGTGHDVFEAHQAGDIKKFFKFVTMSVTQRSVSGNPNEVPSTPMPTPDSSNNPQPTATPTVAPQAAPQPGATSNNENEWF